MQRYEDDYDETDYREAHARVKEKREYFQSLVSYVVVIGFLAFINLFTSPSYLWFLWPAMGWGIGIFFQTLKVYGGSAMGRDWEARELEKELARRGKRQRPRAEPLPPPRRDLLDETETVRERLRPRRVREDYDDSEFV